MVLVRRWHSPVCVPRAGRGLAALGVCLALGACASGNGPSPLSLNEPLPAASRKQTSNDSAEGRRQVGAHRRPPSGGARNTQRTRATSMRP